MNNPAITPPSSYVHKETPKPTLSRHDDTVDIGVPDSKNADTGLTAQESSESFTIYSTNPSEKRITNGNGSNYQKNKPFKLADGFICLIIIGLLFILATSFYFYMRRRRKNRSVASQGMRGSGSSPDLTRNVVASSGPSSRPSTLSKEPSYHIRGARYGEKHRQYVPDSGTDISNRYNKMDNINNDNPMFFRNSNAATINMYPLQNPPNDTVPHEDQFEHWRAIDINEQSSYAAGKVNQEYTDHCVRTAAAEPATRNVYGVSNGIECMEPTNGDEGRLSDKRNYTLREPAKAQLPSPDPYQYNPVDPENSKMTIRLHMSGNNKAGGEYNRDRGTAPNESKSAASNQGEKQNMLLDTSSVNPEMSAPTKNNFQKQQQKPRKLIRDSTKRNKAPSPAKDVKVPGVKTENKYEHKGNTSLRTMFRNQPPEQKYSHKGKSACKVEHPVDNNSLSDPDISRQEIQNKLKNENLLTDSIESLSDSYQLAVRHKPPLGPLRAVEPHSPSLNDELTVERGDRMYVFGEFADGWVLSINVTRGKDMGMN
ncbi:hypothetical protein IWW48_004944 [Coemansia sp. RSA 1200]|nr:hypothetical protein IWW48_004944 [Coemansia sp. RSA 1200]